MRDVYQPTNSLFESSSAADVVLCGRRRPKSEGFISGRARSNVPGNGNGIKPSSNINARGKTSQERKKNNQRTKMEEILFLGFYFKINNIY